MASAKILTALKETKTVLLSTQIKFKWSMGATTRTLNISSTCMKRTVTQIKICSMRL
jgi:hypothetical protein